MYSPIVAQCYRTGAERSCRLMRHCGGCLQIQYFLHRRTMSLPPRNCHQDDQTILRGVRKETRTLKPMGTTLTNPSVILGSRYLEAKLVKAECGRMFRFSGFITPVFNARKVSLCSQSFAGAVKWTQCTGIFAFLPRSVHTLRVSRSALVLSNLLSAHSSGGKEAVKELTDSDRLP